MISDRVLDWRNPGVIVRTQRGDLVGDACETMTDALDTLWEDQEAGAIPPLYVLECTVHGVRTVTLDRELEERAEAAEVERRHRQAQRAA